MSYERKEILKPYIVLCEGVDAQHFLIWFLSRATQSEPVFDEFQVLDFGGITQLSTYLEILKNMRGYDKVKSIGIIRDAETNHSGAAQSISGSLSRHSLPVPAGPCTICSASDAPATGFALFPSCSASTQNGTLEDLCINALSGANMHAILADVDSILEKYAFSRKHKNRLHSYFSLTDEFVSMKIGEACRANAFLFDAPPLVALKDFLKQLAV